jgi:hypothetical protein
MQHVKSNEMRRKVFPDNNSSRNLNEMNRKRHKRHFKGDRRPLWLIVKISEYIPIFFFLFRSVTFIADD